jgi:hypothetical protein
MDDMLIFGKDLKDINTTKTKLKRFHPMKDLGLAQKILGIWITWGGHQIQLDQEFYARSILEEFGMSDSSPQCTPLNPSMDLNNKTS